MMLTPATAQGPRLTKKDGLEEPIEKGHVDLTYVYADGKWEIFLQVDEGKLQPIDEAVQGVPSLAPGDNVLVAADHPQSIWQRDHERPFLATHSSNSIEE